MNNRTLHLTCRAAPPKRHAGSTTQTWLALTPTALYHELDSLHNGQSPVLSNRCARFGVCCHFSTCPPPITFESLRILEIGNLDSFEISCKLQQHMSSLCATAIYTLVSLPHPAQHATSRITHPHSKLQWRTSCTLHTSGSCTSAWDTYTLSIDPTQFTLIPSCSALMPQLATVVQRQ